MSTKRKLRRQMQRTLVKTSIDNSKIDALVDATNEVANAKYKASLKVAPEVVETVRRKMETNMVPRVEAEMLSFFWAWLAFGKHHTGKWLRENFMDFNAFVDIMERDKTTHNERIEALKEEKGVDLKELLLLSQAQKEKDDKEYNQTRRRLLKSGAIA